jgi:two-component system OmpR family sensor kinase
VSIRLRLTVWYASVLGVVLVVVGTTIYVLLSHALGERTDHSLVELADAFIAVLDGEAKENPHLDIQGVAAEAVSEFRYGERRVALYALDGRLIAAADPPPTRRRAAIVPLPSAGEVRRVAGAHARAFRSVRATDGDTRLVLQVATVRGAPYVAVAAGSLRNDAELRRTARWLLLLVVPAALLLASSGGYLLARAALAPVDAMRREAAGIDARNLHTRVSSGSSRDEIGGLADAFNALLSRLERAFEQQRRFMADASHEIRTPVAIVRGESEVALSGQDRDVASLRESLAVVAEEGRRLSRIVEDLFTLARADAGQHPLVPADFYFEELVEECVRAYRSLAAYRDVRLVCRVPGEVPFRGDEGLLRRMMLNLLDNAAKHTGAGGTVQVTLEVASDGVHITVQDSGGGIPAAARPHIFDRFYRADAARTRAGGGAGLGLPIARWIAEAHGGSLDLTDTGPRGTTFAAVLPLARGLPS